MPLGSLDIFRSVRCPQCSTALAAESWENPSGVVTCPNCASQLTARIFPAIGRERPKTTAGDFAVEGESVCFFHPEKRASIACERCGRFVCELCDMPIGTRHLCPACIGGGLGTEKLPELITRRTCWMRLAMYAGVAPILITVPLTIGLVIYGWRKPGSIVTGPRRWVGLIAIVLALTQVAVFALIVWG